MTYCIKTFILFCFLFTFQLNAIEFTTAGNALEEFRSLRPDLENYPDFYRLTPNGYGQRGALWVNDPIDLDETFLIEFTANFGDSDLGADGIALVFHKDSDLENLVGVGGEGMGYQGIDNSLALEFDTFENKAPGYPNRDDISQDHFDIRRNGDIHFDPINGINPKKPLVDKCGDTINVENGKNITIQVIWIPGDPNIDVSIGTLKVFFNCFELYNETAFDFDENLGWTDLKDVYFGLTAATGNRRNFHRVKITEPVLTVSSTPLCRNIQLSADFPSFCGSVNYKWTASDGTQNGLINPNSKNPIATISDTYTCEIDFGNSDFDILNNGIQSESITVHIQNVVPEYSFRRKLGNSFVFDNIVSETQDGVCGAQLTEDCGYLITSFSSFYPTDIYNGLGTWLIRTSYNGDILWSNYLLNSALNVDLNSLTPHQIQYYKFFTVIHNSIDDYGWIKEEESYCNEPSFSNSRINMGFFLTGEANRVYSSIQADGLPGGKDIILAKIDTEGNLINSKMIDFDTKDVGLKTYQLENDKYYTLCYGNKNNLFLGISYNLPNDNNSFNIEKKFEIQFTNAIGDFANGADFISFNDDNGNQKSVYACTTDEILVCLVDDIFNSTPSNFIIKQAMTSGFDEERLRLLHSKADNNVFYVVTKKQISKFTINSSFNDFDLNYTYEIDFSNSSFLPSKIGDVVLNEDLNEININIMSDTKDISLLTFDLSSLQISSSYLYETNNVDEIVDNLLKVDNGLAFVNTTNDNIDIELVSHQFNDIDCPITDNITANLVVPTPQKTVSNYVDVVDATIVEIDSYLTEVKTYPIEKDYNCLNVDDCDCSELDESSFLLYSEAMPRDEYDEDCCFEIFLKNTGNCALTNFDLNITQSVDDLVTDLNPTQSFQLLQVNEAISLGTICLPYGEESVDIEVGIKKNNLSCTNEEDEVISLSTEVGCFESCCDLIDVNFRIGDSGNTDYCYWFPNVTTKDEAACNINQVEVDVYYNDELVEPDGSGFIGLFDNTGTKKVKFDIKYVVKINGVICRERYTTLACLGCDCPPEYETAKWINVTSDPFDVACPGDECLVTTTSLDIPRAYKDCFNQITVNYKIKDNNVLVEEGNGIPLYTNSVISKCVGAGESIQFEYMLSSIHTDIEDTCIVYSDRYTCEGIEMIERPSPCDIGSNPAWEDPKQAIVYINGCQYVVSYHYRKAGGMQDVQMTMVTRIGDCQNPVPDDSVFKVALPVVISEIIDENREYDPQDNASIKCVSYWRVVQNSCWAKYLVGYDDYYAEVLVPCNSDCCARQLKVCNDGDSVTVTDIGFVYGTSNYNCSWLGVPNGTIPENALNNPSCTDLSCDVFIDLDEVTDTPIDIRKYNYEEEALIKSVNPDFLNDPEAIIIYQFENTNDKLELSIVRTLLKEGSIEIYDLSAKLVGRKEFNNLNNGDILNYDSSQLTSGTYILNFVANGKIYATNKFQVVR